MKVTITLTAEQVYTIQEALELFSRIHMGQFDIIEWQMQIDTFDPTLKRPKYDRQAAQLYLNQARQTIFTDINSNSYIGILNTAERSKIAWDIYQQIRHDISHFRSPNEPLESRGNCFDKPFVVSKQPLPKVVITGE